MASGVRRNDGNIFVHRCSETDCDGSHVLVKIGKPGKPPIARHVTDAAGAREIAAMFCEVAAEIEAHGLAVKLS